MALIKCPECGHQVSDKAATCPNCGVAIAGNPDIAPKQTETQLSETRQTEPKGKKSKQKKSMTSVRLRKFTGRIFRWWTKNMPSCLRSLGVRIILWSILMVNWIMTELWAF